MNVFLVLLTVVSISVADVSHLVNRSLPTNHQHIGKLQNERVETTIEKHKVIELPPQIEIIKNGQSIYGLPLMSNMKIVRPQMAKTRKPKENFVNLQSPEPDRLPYEMAMRSYLPPVLPEITTTKMSMTTGEFSTITTETPIASTTPMIEEDLRAGHPTTTVEYTLEATTKPTVGKQLSFASHYLPPSSMSTSMYTAPIMQQNQLLTQTMTRDQYLPPAFLGSHSKQSVISSNQNLSSNKISMQLQLPENPTAPKDKYLPPLIPEHRRLLPSQQLLPAPMTKYHALSSLMSENQYLPPTVSDNKSQEPVDTMLPPPTPKPQPTYRQYQEQLTRNQQQMYHMEQIVTHVPIFQMQPIAPVEPDHSFSEDGYHYKTGGEDLQYFHYRR